MGNTIVATNLTQGPGDIYSGIVGAVEPIDVSVNAAPAASAWNGLGGTNGGVKLTITQTYDELVVDQIVDVVGRRKTKRDFQLDTVLAEPTMENLILSLNESPAITGSSYKSMEPTIDNSATQPNYFAIIFDGYAPGSFRRRVIGRRMLSTNNLAFEYGKTQQTGFTVSFSAHFVSSSIKPFKVVDQTS
jgi:hypothetical protein